MDGPDPGQRHGQLTCSGADMGNQYGDYEGIAAIDGSIHPVWTDRRATVAALDEEVFTATLTAP